MKEQASELQITSLNNRYFRTHLEDCLSLGRPLLIEDVGEELDPALDNLLSKTFIHTGTIDKVRRGSRRLVPDLMRFLLIFFKGYGRRKGLRRLPRLHSLLDHQVVQSGVLARGRTGFLCCLSFFQAIVTASFVPHDRQVSSKVALVDFTVTQRGLEDQLLAQVVAMERTGLEQERISVSEEVMENKRLIKVCSTAAKHLHSTKTDHQSEASHCRNWRMICCSDSPPWPARSSTTRSSSPSCRHDPLHPRNCFFSIKKSLAFHVIVWLDGS